MLISSISAALASAIAHANAFSLISTKSFSRFFSVSFLESFNPCIGLFGSNITAAATTEPTKGPRPASSAPAICIFYSHKKWLINSHFKNLTIYWLSLAFQRRMWLLFLLLLKRYRLPLLWDQLPPKPTAL